MSVIAYDWIANIDNFTHHPEEKRFEGFFLTLLVSIPDEEKKLP